MHLWLQLERDVGWGACALLNDIACPLNRIKLSALAGDTMRRSYLHLVQHLQPNYFRIFFRAISAIVSTAGRSNIATTNFRNVEGSWSGIKIIHDWIHWYVGRSSESQMDLILRLARKGAIYVSRWTRDLSLTQTSNENLTVQKITRSSLYF